MLRVSGNTSRRVVGYTVTHKTKQTDNTPSKPPQDLFRVGFTIGDDAVIRI